MSEAEIEIQSGIPIPPETRGRPVKNMWKAMEEMEIGQCITVAKSMATARVRIAKALEKQGLKRKFYSQVQVNGKVRIWREE